MKQRPITDDQRKVLETARDHPDETPKEILNRIPDPNLSAKYVQRIMHDYELPPEEPDRHEGEMSYEFDIDTDYEPTLRTVASLSGYSKDVIETVRNNPEITAPDLYEEVDTSPSYVRNILKQHSHLTPDDAAVWDTVDHPTTVDDPSDIGAEKASNIITAILENPEADMETIVDQSGSGKAYIEQTMQVYAHLLPREWCERFTVLNGGINPAEPEPEDGDETEETEPKTGLDALFNDDGFLDTNADPDHEKALEVVENGLDSGKLTKEQVASTVGVELDPEPEYTKADVDDAYEDGWSEAVDEFEQGIEHGTDGVDNVIADVINERVVGRTVDQNEIEKLESEMKLHKTSGSIERASFADGIERTLTVLGLRQS